MLAPLTIAELENRFRLEECAFWFAYEANSKRKMVGRFRDNEPDASEEDKLVYSWMQLEELLSGFPYGKVEVVLKKSESSAVDKSPSYTVEWGVFPQGSRRGGHVSGGIANAGAGNWQMMQYFMDKQSAATQQMQQLQMQLMELRFNNQLLEQALEADNQPGMQEKMLTEVIGAVKPLLAGLATRTPVAPVQVGTLGQRSENKEVGTETKEQASPKAATNTFRIDTALGYIQEITNLFPQFLCLDVLKAFYAFSKTNTELIAGQLAVHIQAFDKDHVVPKMTSMLPIDESLGYVQHITALFPQFDRMDVLRAFLLFAQSNKVMIMGHLNKYLEDHAE